MSFTIELDPAHGGRWRSLRDGSGTEWCWSRPDPRRHRVRPGDAFVDVGGVEECFPTLAGVPDHGDVWTRPWTVAGDGSCTVRTADFQLRRHVRAGRDVRVSYRLEAAPGFRFVWAFHLLVVPAADLAVHLPEGSGLRTWPEGYAAAPVETRWPEVPGAIHLDRAGPDDGTAVFALAPGCRDVTISSGGRRLRLELTADGQPVAVGLWRNLGGYSWDGSLPYRSFGVEPMIGHNPAREHAAVEDLGTVGAAGRAAWSLRLSEAAT